MLFFIEVIMPIIGIMILVTMIVYCYNKANANYDAYIMEITKSVLILDFIERMDADKITDEAKIELVNYMNFLDEEL